MYYLNSIDELNEEKIQKIINSFRGKELVQLEKYRDYYNGDQEILDKYVSDSTKPNNKLVCNYCYDIVQNYCGYMSGIPISYSSNEDITDLMEILKYNDYHKKDNQMLKNALIYGVSYEVNYLDEMAQQRFTTLKSEEIIPIYSNDLQQNLIAVIRLYSANDLDDVNKNYIDIYTDKLINHYETDMSYSSLKLLDSEPHYYGMVPINVMELNDERKSIFDRIINLQDAYNKLISANVDDYEIFVDCYMILKGLTADTEDLKEMKRERVLLLDEDSDAEFLTKDSDSNRVQTLLLTLNDQIQKIAKAPDFNDEKFMAQSGEAIKYKMVGMENNAANIESNMKEALQKRLELLCAIQKLTTNDFIWRDINIIFTRNLPVNKAEEVNIVNQLRGLVSNKTLLSLLSFVKDVDAEIELLKEQEDNQPVYDWNDLNE